MYKRYSDLIISFLLSAGLAIFMTSCSTGIIQQAPIPVKSFLTKSDGSMLLHEQKAVEMVRRSSGKADIILEEQKQCQIIDGFGASMTESSAYTISCLEKEVQEQVMRELFDAESGLGISMVRQPMGASDFALSTYSYNDLEPGETDFSLDHFTIARDKELIIPYLKQAMEINPDLKIIASPWSPPAWMKTGQSMIGAAGGVLRRDCYEVYAQYFVKFIEAYQEEGLPVWGVTIQNEPNYGPASYAGMKWSALEEALFIGSYLGPAFEERGLEALIIGYDHNWDKPEWPKSLLSDSQASKYLAGTAWHYYGGAADTMTRIKELFPDKDIWFTEGSIGTWIEKGSFSATFNHSMQQAISIMNNWSKSLIWWNISLDKNNGPIVFKNTTNYGLMCVDTISGERVMPNRASWYSLGHFSRYIHPGAVKIGTSGTNTTVMHCAFKNPDGSLALVLYNHYFSKASIIVESKHRQFKIEIPPRSAVTVVWDNFL